MRSLITLIEDAMRSELLLEVVLLNQVDTVLAPFLGDLADQTAKSWFHQNFANWLTKQPANLHQLTYLPPTAGEKQKKAFQYNDLWDIRLTSQTQTLISHLVDFFNANRNLPRLDRMSVENVEQAAEQWVKRMNAKAEREPDDLTQVKVMMEYPNGFTMVQLLGANALSREGAKMGHCVGGYCEYVTSGQTKIFSLRDPNNVPHATIELRTEGNTVNQIKGRQNRAPVLRYWSMIRQFLESISAQISRDYKNVGLLQIYDYDTGKSTTMTQDQFRDMVLDPADKRGQQFLDRGNFNDDTALGLFVSLYGTPRLTDAVIKRAFSGTPDLAVQTVATSGNHFTQDQLIIAFRAMGDSDIHTIKELMRVAKPDVAVVEAIMADEDSVNNKFIIAVAQELPQVYSSLLDSDPEFLANELNQRGLRSSGPFYVYAGTDKLTAEMVQKAFDHTPVDAMRRVIKVNLSLDSEQTVAALAALTVAHYRELPTESKQVLDRLMDYTKPDAAVLEQLMTGGSLNKHGVAALLTSARKYVPDQISKEVTERALMAIEAETAYRDYFATEPNPSLAIQDHLFHKKATLLHYVQVIDPSLWPLVYRTLRPAKVDRQEVKKFPKKDKNGQYFYINKNGYKQQATYDKTIDKDPAQYTKELSRSRKVAIKRFTSMLDPLVREPTQDNATMLEPNNPKMLAAQRAFAEMNKSALFDLALKHLNRTAQVLDVTGDGNQWGGGRIFDSAKFAEAVKTMRMQEIAQIIDGDGYRGSHRFGIFLRNAPTRTAEFLKYWFSNRNSNQYPWGDFKFAIDKDTAFAALSNVWESNLADDIKDRFATAVLKRFKPSPANLLTMLQKANNEDITHKILKKTKKPSPELIDWIASAFPTEIRDEVPLNLITDASLANIFKTHPRLAHALLDRDIRDYGSDNKRWGYSVVRKRTERTGDAYQRYAAAAKVAGKEAVFDKFIHQAELDDDHESHDAPAIASNLSHYSNATLIKIVHKDPRHLPVLFKSLEPKQLAALIGHGILRTGTSQWNSHGNGVDSLDGINPEKIKQVAAVLAGQIQNGKKSEKGDDLAKAVLKANIPLDDKFIINLVTAAKSESYSSGNPAKQLIERLTTDEGKDWVADHMVHEMVEIAVPTLHMVAVLFDTWGTSDKNDKGKPSYFFISTVEGWFREGGKYYGGTFRANPVAAKLLKDEAIKRGGQAIQITKQMFKILADKRNEAKRVEAAREQDRVEAAKEQDIAA